MSLSKYFKIECFVLSKFDWRKCLKAFQKTICTKRPYVSFLDFIFFKVFRDRDFVLSKFDWRKSLNAFQKTICTKRPCVSCLDYVFVKVFRDWVFRAIKIRLKKKCRNDFQKRFVLRDPLFLFWNFPLSKYFEIECFVLSKFDWRKCLNPFKNWLLL